MNKRIKKLAEQAGAVFEKTNGLNDCPQDSLVDTEIEKFAELIVRECANWLKQPVNQTPSCGEVMNIAADRLKEHFGVEP